MTPPEFFTVHPHWQWWIVVYFFFGGIAAGSFFIAALLDLVGGPEDRPLSRYGYLIAFPLISLGLLLLVLDLNQPFRFWHMMLQNNRYLPMFKWWSPISFGTWIISAFSGFAGIAFLAALVKPGEAPRRGPLGLFHKIVYGLGVLSKLFLIGGALFATLTAAYTGVLLTVTNRPVWGNTNLLGWLFLFSGFSTAAAALTLIAIRRRTMAEGSLHRLARFDDLLLIGELLLIVATLYTIREVFGAPEVDAGWLTLWGGLLLLTAVGGVLVPLLLTIRSHALNFRTASLAAVLVLLGGFGLRVVAVMSSETIHQVERVAGG